ncbi:glucose-1-phosphate thymidylyltransferase RfbA [Enterobacter asburiae]|uniref:glucose-1-phosphate thymidylyltransferase RfbA n=1 Tax=Scandinavium sp. UTDF21-P1B TaxID=3446379 RepID=UPI00347A28A0
MKGIILAGGSGTRLYPTTIAISKQLLSVYDKPMIYYPLAVLMQAGVRDILIITTPEDQGSFIRLLGNGGHMGINLSYAIQPEPAGLAQAFIIGEKFIGHESVFLILGDNIFIGQHSFNVKLSNPANRTSCGATIYCHQVADPCRFGVVELDASRNVLSIEEKPERPKSDWAVTGLYHYDSQVVDIAKTIKPSGRGELEITCVNATYLKNNALNVEFLAEDVFWLDTGTNDSLHMAGSFVKQEQHKHNLVLSCPEEIAWRNGWLSDEELYHSAEKLKKGRYGDYLFNLLVTRTGQCRHDAAGLLMTDSVNYG